MRELNLTLRLYMSTAASDSMQSVYLMSKKEEMYGVGDGQQDREELLYLCLRWALFQQLKGWRRDDDDNDGNSTACKW